MGLFWGALMRKFAFAVLATALLASPTIAWAVTSSAKVIVGSDGTPLAGATISLQRVQSASVPKPRVVPPRAPAPTDAGGGTALTFDTEDRNATFSIVVRDRSGRVHRLPPLTLDDIIKSGIDIKNAVPSAPARAMRPVTPPAEPVVFYPGSGGLPLSFGASFTQVPQISGGTRLSPGGAGEVPIISSRRTIPGVSGSLGIVVPTDRVFFSFDYFQIDAGINAFDDSVQGSAPVGTSSAFTYIFPNPVSGSTGVGPTVTGQTVTIGTKGTFWDLALGPTARVPARPVSAGPSRFFWTYGVGLRYRYMNTEHNISQQSLTFADLNSAIGLGINSHFIAPNFAVGFEAVQPLPSGAFAGGALFFAPGALISDASATQTSRCGPCGGASPEFNVVLRRNFNDTSFAFMTGVNGFVGYRFSPHLKVQAEGSINYLSDVASLAVPTSPVDQPIRIVNDSLLSYSVGGRLVFDFSPTQDRMRPALSP